MADNELSERLKEIISKQLGKEVQALREETKFIEDLGADSLDMVEIVMAIEDEFELDIPDEDSTKLHTVAAVIEYVENARKM